METLFIEVWIRLRKSRRFGKDLSPSNMLVLPGVLKGRMSGKLIDLWKLSPVNTAAMTYIPSTLTS